MSETLNASFTQQSLGVSFQGQSLGASVRESERVPTPGEKGDPGFSPIVSVEDIPGGHEVTITDEQGDHSFDVMDGAPGEEGAPGKDGKDGMTPEIFTTAVTLSPGSSAYANTTGTVEQPLITFGIPRGDTGAAGKDGTDGKDGKDGKNGTDGKDGADGVSPEVTIANITGGHSVTITDADHPGGQTFNVMDGAPGQPGTTTYTDLTDKPSINGTTLSGDVTITAADVGALPDTYTAPVTSVNTQTGAVVLSKSDVGLGNVDNVQQYSASNPPPYPVTSVNGSTGAVTVTVPTKTSDLQNDSGYITDAGVTSFNGATGAVTYTAPVTSVNSQTGDVTLSIPSTAADVGALPDDTKYAASPTVGGVASKAAAIPFGKLDGTSTATVMTAQVSGITELKSGVCMWLTNGVVTGGSNFTLNINSLGAKPVYQSQAAAGRVSSVFNVNYTALMIYNEDRVAGGCWDYVYGYDSNTNTVAYQVRTQNTTLPMDSITYRYRLLFQSPDGTKFIPANNSNSTNATASRTVIQTPIDPFGLIVYYGTTASVAAGARPNSSYLWQQFNDISIGYSFNNTGAAATMTQWEPLYLKCTPQSDGSAIIDSTTPYVQALPTTEDGKIYIFLGTTASATTFMLTLEHPVYHYKGGHVRLWTNADVGVTSVNGSTGAVTLSIPSTASDVGAVAVAQGAGHAGEFLVVGSNGNVTTMTLSTWQGGSY